MSKTTKYGDGLLKNVSLDLQADFPGEKGLSLTNIKAARRWYKTYYQWVIKSQQSVDFFGDYSKDGYLSMPYFFANVPWGIISSAIAGLPLIVRNLPRLNRGNEFFRPVGA